MEPRSILLVDDDKPVRDVVRMALEQVGHKVESVADGTSASDRLRQNSYDVLITDMLMPDRDGIELIREVRRRYPRVRILAISGGGLIRGGDYLQLARGLGADLVLEKPFLPDEICAAVAKLSA